MSNVKISSQQGETLRLNAIELLEKHTGNKRILKGIKHNNWVFITDDGQEPELLVKFVPEKEAERLETEIALNEYIKKHVKIPMPEIIHHGKLQNECYLIRTMLKGKSLGDLTDTLAGEDLENIYYQSGKLLARIHSHSFSKKGIINHNLEIDDTPIFSQKELESFSKKLLKNNAISDSEFEKLNSINVAYYFDNEPNVLCHCDFGTANILINNDDVSGIIDFEWASSAPCMDDLASFELFTSLDEVSEPIHQFYKGYESVRTIPSIYTEHKEFYLFYRLLTTYSYQVNAQDEEIDTEVHNKMKRLFKYYISNLNQFLK